MGIFETTLEAINVKRAAAQQERYHQHHHQVAKKSTSTTSYATSTAANACNMSRPLTRRAVAKDSEKFLRNFNPETSAREKRKLTRKITEQQKQLTQSPSVGRRPYAGTLYDRTGVHIASKVDLCDCLCMTCDGCWFPCPKCGSHKCGVECRINRKMVYELIEYNSCDIVTKNPLLKQARR